MTAQPALRGTGTERGGLDAMPSISVVDAAVRYARNGWAVFPLRRDKTPFASCPRCARYQDGKRITLHPSGQCVHGLNRVCHGLLAAVADVDMVTAWWRGPYRGANIGARVPTGLFVLDVDPRAGGDQHLAELEQTHGPLPPSPTVLSGRGDGGRHHYLQHPGGKVSQTRLPKGVEIKTSSGYVLLPPSTHPATGKPYMWVQPVPQPPPAPAWLLDLLLPAAAPKPTARPWRPSSNGAGSAGTARFSVTAIADAFNATASWADILVPHGWACLDHNPDTDGAAWRHPAATSRVSATVRHGCLFVYTPNTPLPQTAAGDPRGVTRFRAHVLLNHAGDYQAAARDLAERGYGTRGAA